MKKTMQKGFSLVELMVVIAIIAILAAVAVPMYSNYTDRARISGEISQLGAAKNAVAEALIAGGTMPTTSNGATITTSGSSMPIAEPSSVNDTIGQISFKSVVASGATINMIPWQEGSSTSNNTVTLDASNQLNWTCLVSGTNITQSQLPSQCTAV